MLRRLLHAAYQQPGIPVRHLLCGLPGPGRAPLTRGTLRQALRQAAVPSQASAADITADQWHQLTMLLIGLC